ncbi:carboxypeptidase-like regulatory domain-containing protein [Psychroserpens sp. Hel_I_66]|uniref:carboxypeptidase-like regulatory domain-containing protein n=1 Tax=Psychroserpens sp. Hel_I_66 TaxID=1250004 RepID=UPI000646F811|nr:carboxypeptidase-like regulatory domain-containing protein [Psychroserpens sp. Hel_I_66]
METLKTNILKFLLFLCAINVNAQSISGIVLDAKSNEPIESASVFFDNTTIGTSTDNKGSFEISVEPGINSPLIISFLGYEKIAIDNYSANKFYKILLVEEQNSLDEVYLTYFDGMSKETKMNHFRDHFLGISANGKSCTISNEKDLILRFNKKTKQLIASSKRPVRIKNENLQYEIEFDIKDFIIDYSYVDLEKETFRVRSVVYTGTSFFKPLEDKNHDAEKKRDSTYKGSILHFMRALSKENLEAEGYQVFSQGFVVDPTKYINVRAIKTSDSVKVKLRLPLSILYNTDYQSTLVSRSENQAKKPVLKKENLKPKIGDTIHISSLNNSPKKTSNLPYFNTEIIIDGFGNYSPVGAFYFMGFMSKQRVGDTLPLDYNLEN